MSLRPEPDISAIRQHLHELRQLPSLGRARQWWPACLFHCTDISNVVSILSQGEIVSRRTAIATGKLQRDIASPDVIAGTATEWQDYVRLYFRPRTPTQYNNEGFRPVGQRAWNSHCPVPVYLIFDSLAVLSRADSCFSDGNLGSAHANASQEVSFLRQVPFDLVYHDSSFDPQDRDQIVHHRNAEVLVPQRLGLEGLRHIICRSDAEYETLLHLLPPGTRSRWVSKLGVRPNLQLFNRKWTFVEQVAMSSKAIALRFNKSSITPGPFEARLTLEETATGTKYGWRSNQCQCYQDLELPITILRSPSDYSVSLFLDDQLAYANRFQADYLPL